MVDNYNNFFFLPLNGMEPLELAQRFRASMGPHFDKYASPDEAAEAVYFASIVAKAFAHTPAGKMFAKEHGFEPNSLAAIEEILYCCVCEYYKDPITPLEFIASLMNDLKSAAGPFASEGLRACESLKKCARRNDITSAAAPAFSRIRLHGLAPSPQQQPTQGQASTPPAPAEGSFVKRKPEAKVREEMAPQSINLPKSDVAKLFSLREEAEAIGCEVPTLAEIVRSLLSKAVEKVEYELAVAKASSNAASFGLRPRDLPPSPRASVDESPRRPGPAALGEQILSLLPEDYRHMLRSAVAELGLDPEGPESIQLAMNYLDYLKRNSGSPFDKAYFGSSPAVFCVPEMPGDAPQAGSVSVVIGRDGSMTFEPKRAPAADKAYDGTVSVASGSLSGTDAGNYSKSFDGHVATGE